MTPDDWQALDSVISGEVVLPEAAAYDRTYPALNARFDTVRPQAVVRCAEPEDVAHALRFARRRGIAVATRGGGHCFGGRSSTEGLQVDVSRMSTVRLSGDEVTVGGGTRLGQLYGTLFEHGLAVPGGSCPTVGVAGLALGGGLGILGRTHGLTSDHLLRAEIVMADGRVLECDDEHEPDLFWALRGAGAGNFGVVTSMTLRTVKPPDATNFTLTWPFTEAAAVAEAWLSWSPDGPPELAASLVIGAGPDPDEEPSVEVFGVVLGPESDADDLIDRLVGSVRSEPRSSFRRSMTFAATTRYWADRAARDRVEGDPPGWELRGHRAIRSEFFDRSLSKEVIEQLLRWFAAGRTAGQSRELDFSPWGGAYNAVPPDATAFVHRLDRYWLKHATEVEPGATRSATEAAYAWVTGSWDIVHPSGTGRVFPNFPDPDLEDWAHAYHGSNLDRLVRLKARYDPENLFRFTQSVPAG